MIVILSDEMTDGEIDFINKIFLEMNAKMYNISFDVLKSKVDAEEAVTETFFEIIKSIENISILPYSQIENYCLIILKNQTINIIKKRKKVIHIENVDYFNHSSRGYNTEEEYLKTANERN